MNPSASIAVPAASAVKSFRTALLAALVAAIAMIKAQAADSVADIPAAEIIRLSQAKYAALTSYRDEGTTMSKLGQTLAANFNFSIKLARTNCYEVWRQGDDLFKLKGAVWSAGAGDFLWMGAGFTTKKMTNPETALASATGISGGVAATVPCTFFGLKFGNQLAAARDAVRQADGKIGGVECFVLVHGSEGRTNTLWIGQQDFLIHQVENDTSGSTVKAILEKQAQTNPQIRGMLEAAGSQLNQDIKSVETHRNIVVNPALTGADFEVQIPSGSQP